MVRELSDLIGQHSLKKRDKIVKYLRLVFEKSSNLWVYGKTTIKLDIHEIDNHDQSVS